MFKGIKKPPVTWRNTRGSTDNLYMGRMLLCQVRNQPWHDYCMCCGGCQGVSVFKVVIGIGFEPT